MRISDIKGERCFDVLADLIEPVTVMAMDQDVVSFFKPLKASESTEDDKKSDVKGMLLHRVREFAPTLVKNHKKELIDILCIIADVPTEEYLEKMTIGSLIVDVVELFTDEAFTELF